MKVARVLYAVIHLSREVEVTFFREQGPGWRVQVREGRREFVGKALYPPSMSEAALVLRRLDWFSKGAASNSPEAVR